MLDKDTQLSMEAIVNEAVKKARWVWMVYVKAGLRGALLALVLGIEFELLYRTFAGIAGEDHQYWSPGLMALTGVIMVSAFHLLARLGADNPALKLIHKTTPYLLSVYLCGLGLLTAGIINLDAGAVLLENPAQIIIGGLPSEQSRPWLSLLFEKFTNPLALALFSFGIGGLAIVNLFVAHELTQGLHKNINHIHNVKSEADRLQSEYKTVQRAQENARELQAQLQAVDLWSQGAVLQEAALVLSTTIQDASAKHRRFIKGKELTPPPGPLSLFDPIDPKLIERDLKKIEALDLKSIHKLLSGYAKPQE